MKVSTRIFICYLVISAVCLYYPFDWVLDTMRTRYLEGVEDPLVDQANTLAALVEHEMAQERFDPDDLGTVFEQVYLRRVNADIYRLLKKRVDTEVYITDAEGIVIFHSTDPEQVGADFSTWRDVYLTLNGRYGARSSRTVETDAQSAVLYVAAPLVMDGTIVGVLTVGKPTTNISWFVKNAKLQVVGIALLALVVAGLLGFLVARWITVPIKRLTGYAESVSAGKRADFPPLGKSEIGEMGRAFEKMQEALEGKRYVEQYIQNLTHEIKSPLSAIRGAAELLGESMDDGQRQRFLANIDNESRRIQVIIDRMLDLSALENRNRLGSIETISIRSLVNTVLESLEPTFARKGITGRVEIDDDLRVKGDVFLLHQALVNLVQNSCDFSGAGTTITVRAIVTGTFVDLLVCDQGTGIADYAKERIFEKFFSLQRPDTDKKSTGLGLNFVRQVALLHGGDIRIVNRPEGGAEARLSIRKSPDT
ncbi:MAG: two-component system sensor histidine kinase CreC [Proteobacteria bacterium]|nr:MAG: two-component system sensor histidine kinase CreC [Pseudomonadota bacterium]PIE64814.1 MAG: two-component system sensor histidine kinase CreC [Desulfobacterales bacterium]